MDRRSVLLVAYHFPPFGGSGVQRALKFAKHLPQFGWDVHVLTADHRHYPVQDHAMLDELGGRVTIHRVRGFEPGALAASMTDCLRACWPSKAVASLSRVVEGRPFEVSDEFSSMEDRIFWRIDRIAGRLHRGETESLWIGSAIRAARRIVKQFDIDAVITTSPPHAVHRVGAELRESPGIRWIADLRDPILDNFTFDPASAGPREINRRNALEARIVQRADHVVVTCPELADRLKERHGSAMTAGAVFIPNGFDPADLPARETSNINPAPLSSVDGSRSGHATTRQFNLTYVGAFYGAQTIEPLRLAVRCLSERDPSSAERLSIRVVGHVSRSQWEMFTAADERRFTFEGYFEHRGAIAAMQSADALFLMTPTNAGGRFCIPAKVFEYLAFGRHMIAVVHPGTELSQILRSAGETTVLEHGSALVGNLANAIQSRMYAPRRIPAPRCDQFLHPFRRDVQARALAGLLEPASDRPGCRNGSGPRSMRPPLAIGGPA